jgi:type IV secretion system protein VirB11
MARAFSDAIVHLEKDMADILEVLNDKEVTEVILNPYHSQDGTIQGHILVDRHGVGIRNLIKHTECLLEAQSVSLSDIVLYKYSEVEPCNILFWVKLPWVKLPWVKLPMSDIQYSFELTHHDLSKLSFLSKSYFAQFDDDIVIKQTDEFQILEYAKRIEDKSFTLSSVSLEQLISELNNELPECALFRFGFKEVFTPDDISLFKAYPKKLIKSEVLKMTSTKAETIMSVLASITGKFIHGKSPYLECQIPKYGHRFTGVIPPASHYPAFCIRKHASKVYTLDDFVSQGVLQDTSCKTIRSWIKRKLNILIAGGTGSGKTTLANAILHEISTQFPDTRMLIIEDVPELQFSTSRSVSFKIGEFFSMYDSLWTTLLFKPERIVMGEVRGAEAYTLLKAWNTGHPGGVATIHANGVNEALYRFESCIRDNKDARVNRQEIGFTINGIIAIQNITLKEEFNGEYLNVVKRKVTALRQIIQYDTDKDIYQDIVFDRCEDSYDI